MNRPTSFNYPSVARRGGIVTFDEIRTIKPSPQLVKDIQAAAPGVQEIELYRGAKPGPRFCQIDGTFFRLNGKAKRGLSYVISNKGPMSVHDATEPPSPLAERPDLVRMLVTEAGE